MTAAELLTADDHIAGCEGCRQVLLDPERVGAMFRTLDTELQVPIGEPGSHLDYEQLTRYVDGVLEDVGVEIVLSHLAICSECELRVSDLREARAMLRPAPIPRHDDLQFAWWDAIRRLMSAPPRWAYASAAAATIVLVAGIAIWPGRTNVPDTRGRRDSPALRRAPAAVSVVRDGGTEVALDQEGALAGLQLPPGIQQAVANALRSGRVQVPPTIAALSPASGQLLGTPREIPRVRLLAPVGTAVESDRPVLRWQGPSTRAIYRVDIYDSNFTKVAGSPRLTTAEWTPVVRLSRGRIYLWQVTAQIAGVEVVVPAPPAPEAKFLVVDEGTSSRLDALTRAYPQYHLVLGTAYAEAGVLDLAEAEFQSLRQLNPQSPIARNLLEMVQSVRGRGQNPSPTATKGAQ